MTYQAANSFTIAQVMALVFNDIRKAKSDGDLKRRLANKGYGVAETAQGRMLTTLPHGVILGTLPAVAGIPV